MSIKGKAGFDAEKPHLFMWVGTIQKTLFLIFNISYYKERIQI